MTNCYNISSPNTAKIHEEDGQQGMDILKNKKGIINFIIISLISLHIIAIVNVIIVKTVPNNKGKFLGRNYGTMKKPLGLV